MKKISIILMMLPLLAVAQHVDRGENSLRVTYNVMMNTPKSLNGFNLQNGSTMVTDEHHQDVTLLYGAINVEWDFRLNPYLEVGVLGGLRKGSILYSETEMFPLYAGNDWGKVFYKSVFAPSLDISLRFFFSELSRMKSRNWDFYAICRAGIWYCNGPRKEYGIGAGANWFPTRHFGFTSDLMIGKFPGASRGKLLESDAQFNIGVVFSF